MRKSGLALVFLCLAGGALAQTYSVEPGLWKVEGDGLMAGLEVPVEREECLTEEDAEIDAKEALKSATGVSCEFEHANSRNFTVSCPSQLAFSATGTLDVERRKIVVEAAGYVMMEGVGNVPAFFNVTARHVGACPAL